MARLNTFFIHSSSAHLLCIVLRNCSVKQCLHIGQILREKSQLLLQLNNIGVHVVAISTIFHVRSGGEVLLALLVPLHDESVPGEV